MEPLSAVMLITGHYGSGKSNFALNLANDLAAQGNEVVLADIDIVNPYFRSAEMAATAEEKGVELVAPPFAGSNLDIPVLSAAVDAALAGGKKVILDVGGDDAGAIALGRYAPQIMQRPYSLLYVMNFYRPQTQTVEEQRIMLSHIESASRLKASHLVHNSNLGEATQPHHVTDKMKMAEEMAQKSGLPLWATTVRRDLAPQLAEIHPLYPMDIYIKAPWS